MKWTSTSIYLRESAARRQGSFVICWWYLESVMLRVGRFLYIMGFKLCVNACWIQTNNEISFWRESWYRNRSGNTYKRYWSDDGDKVTEISILGGQGMIIRGCVVFVGYWLVGTWGTKGERKACSWIAEIWSHMIWIKLQSIHVMQGYAVCETFRSVDLF